MPHFTLSLLHHTLFISLLHIVFDVFNTFNIWKYLVENETGKKLKCLRLNNGGEYCNNEFDNYYSCHGIRREKRVPRHHKKMVCQKE
jgi:hypothetical protein